MPGLSIMLPVTVLLALGFLIFFFWSVKNRDYDDPEMTAVKMVMDDEDDVDRSMQPKAPKAKKEK